MDIQLVEILSELLSNCNASMPKVIADEGDICLFFYLKNKKDRTTGLMVPRVGDENWDVVMFKFKNARNFRFGGPNDEVLHGHPYYSFGLRSYAIYNVENSDWIREMERINSVHRSHQSERFKELQHLFFTFHDSCFEVVCEEYSYEIFDETELRYFVKTTVDHMLRYIKQP